MALFLIIFNVVAPVFLIAGSGYLWVKQGVEYPTEFVTRLATKIAVPCLVFDSLMTTEIDPEALATMFWASVVTYGVAMITVYVFLKIAKLDMASYFAPFVSGNTGNMGLPLCLFAFGQAGFGYAIILFSVTSVFAFSIGIYVITGGTSLRKLVREPLVISTLLGLLFLVQGWQLPEFLTNTINLVGRIGIPIMLITLGVAVARLKPANIVSALWLSAAKIAICTLVAIGVGSVFDLPDTAYAVLVLQMSAPVAVTSYLLAERYKVDAEAVAGLVVVSTVMTIGVAPLILSFLLVSGSAG